MSKYWCVNAYSPPEAINKVAALFPIGGSVCDGSLVTQSISATALPQTFFQWLFRRPRRWEVKVEFCSDVGVN